MVFKVGEVNVHNIKEFILRESWVNGKKGKKTKLREGFYAPVGKLIIKKNKKDPRKSDSNWIGVFVE